MAFIQRLYAGRYQGGDEPGRCTVVTAETGEQAPVPVGAARCLPVDLSDPVIRHRRGLSDRMHVAPPASIRCIIATDLCSDMAWSAGLRNRSDDPSSTVPDGTKRASLRARRQRCREVRLRWTALDGRRA